MNIADIMEMMRNPQALQAKAEELRRKTESIEATGSSGGGMVRITINGAMAVKAVVIAPEVVDPRDVAMLQDLVLAAFNDAQAKVRDSLQRELTDGLGGMGLPPGLFGGLVKAIEELVGLLTRLPGIGRKSALRVAWQLLKAEGGYAETLAGSIRDLRDRVRFCSICGSYTESEPCEVCDSPGRDRTVLCVVEQPQDVMTIEASHEFRGLYHVLGGVISPLDGVGPEDIRLDSLVDRIRDGQATEVVVATNPTVEGDTTALFVKRLLEPLGVQVTRLATGIPVGGDLEYADRLTLARSFRGRVRL